MEKLSGDGDAGEEASRPVKYSRQQRTDKQGAEAMAERKGNLTLVFEEMV